MKEEYGLAYYGLKEKPLIDLVNIYKNAADDVFDRVDDSTEDYAKVLSDFNEASETLFDYLNKHNIINLLKEEFEIIKRIDKLMDRCRYPTLELYVTDQELGEKSKLKIEEKLEKLLQKIEEHVNKYGFKIQVIEYK